MRRQTLKASLLRLIRSGLDTGRWRGVLSANYHKLTLLTWRSCYLGPALSADDRGTCGPSTVQCVWVWVDEQQGAAREGRGRKQRGSGGVQEKNDDCGCGDCLTAQSPVSVLTNCPLARHVSNVWNGEYHALLPNSLGDGVYRCLCPRNQSG